MAAPEDAQNTDQNLDGQGQTDTSDSGGGAHSQVDLSQYVPKDRYSNLEKKLGEQGSELGAYRKQVDILTQQLDRMMQQSQQKPAEAPKTDYDKMRMDIAKKVSDGDLSAEEGLGAMAEWAAKFADSRAKAEASDAMERTQAKVLQQLDDRFKQLEAQKVQEGFISRNPDFMDFQRSGSQQDIWAKEPLLQGDDIGAYYANKAAIAEQALAELKQKIENGAKPTGPVMAKPGSGMRRTVDTSKPRSSAEKQSSMMAAAERAMYGV